MRGHPSAGGFGFQLENLNSCFANLCARHSELGLGWLLFTDVDEFVLSNHKDQLLTDLLNDKYADMACMEVGRTYYGTSFHHRRPTSGLVTENYLLASPDYADGYPKMIANIYPQGRQSKQNAISLYSCTTSTTRPTFHAASKTISGIFTSTLTCGTWMDKTRARLRPPGVSPFMAEISSLLLLTHIHRSLEDYEQKVLTGHKVHNRYARPLEIFWERDQNDVLSPIAAEYRCRVRAPMDLAMERERAGKIPNVSRPRSWNETQHDRKGTNVIRKSKPCDTWHSSLHYSITLKRPFYFLIQLPDACIPNSDFVHIKTLINFLPLACLKAPITI